MMLLLPQLPSKAATFYSETEHRSRHQASKSFATSVTMTHPKSNLRLSMIKHLPRVSSITHVQLPPSSWHVALSYSQIYDPASWSNKNMSPQAVPRQRHGNPPYRIRHDQRRITKTPSTTAGVRRLQTLGTQEWRTTSTSL